MSLWKLWTDFVEPLRGACKRRRTFLWTCVVLVGFVARPDLLGVTSMIRATGLCRCDYDRLLDLFHSPALVIDTLTAIWVTLVQLHFPLVRINGRMVVSEIAACHRYIQLGLMAQGTLQYLACCHANEVWKSFGSWIRTILQ